MKFRFEELIVKTRQGVIKFSLSASFTYIYGEISTGKSTIVRLIDYCLGGKLEETPAIQNEFVYATLRFNIGNYFAEFTRNKDDQEITAVFRNDSGEDYSIRVPIVGRKILIPETNVENISDLIFHLAGLIPPRVRRGLSRYDSDLVRLSFRDIMWLCYLDQESIDNAFFYLGEHEDSIRQSKARSALRYVLGYHDDKITELDSKLYSIRGRRESLKQTAGQLRGLLSENQIDSTRTIMERIEKMEESISALEKERKLIREKLEPMKSHLVDDLRFKARQLSDALEEVNSEVKEYETKIQEQKRLLHEYEMSSIRLTRSNIAKSIVRGISFDECPQCGAVIKNRKVGDNKCTLCTQPMDQESSLDIQLLEADIDIRNKELRESIERLERLREARERKLKEIIESKSGTDNEIERLQTDYDSAYLAEASHIERRIGEVAGGISSLRQLMSLPERVEKLEQEYLDLAKEEESVNLELEQLKKKKEKDKAKIIELQEIFLDTLVRVGIPGIKPSDIVTIEYNKFYPTLMESTEQSTTLHFFNAGSGGKKALFKTCFSLAIHRLATRYPDSVLPTFLIIDTPTKSVGEKINEEQVRALFQTLYELSATELQKSQIIVIDNKEYIKPSPSLDLNIVAKKFTSTNPFIPHYVDRQ